MEPSVQQVETLAFFNRVSAEWRAKAEGKLPQVNVIAQRNTCVHRIKALIQPVKSMLDLGCGTGELVLEMVANGVRATGVDFAPEMIRASEEKRETVGASDARFVCASVFDFPAPDESEDLVSALGLIEYVSPAQLLDLLSLCYRVLRPGGALALGSRNRLFNVCSLNQYTSMERSLGTLDTLLGQSMAFTAAENVQQLFAAMESVPRLPQPDSHARTGIGVNLRYQYTPQELGAIVRDAGLIPFAIYPVHYHCIPPAAALRREELHVAFSNLIFETAPDDHRLIPSSSSFVLGARKEG